LLSLRLYYHTPFLSKRLTSYQAFQTVLTFEKQGVELYPEKWTQWAVYQSEELLYVSFGQGSDLLWTHTL